MWEEVGGCHRWGVCFHRCVCPCVGGNGPDEGSRSSHLIDMPLLRTHAQSCYWLDLVAWTCGSLAPVGAPIWGTRFCSSLQEATSEKSHSS